MLLKENDFQNFVFLACLTIHNQEKRSLEISINFSNYFGRKDVASHEDSSFNKTTLIISNLVGKRLLLTVRKYSSGSKCPSTRTYNSFRGSPSIKIVK